MSEMPKEFWVIGVPGVSIIWDRSILGFVPTGWLAKRTLKERMERHWFLSKSEAETQAGEIVALGCKVIVERYVLA